MSEPQDQQKLLTEIRDTQREHLTEYRAVTTRLLANQEQAVRRARKALYVLVGAVFLLIFITFFLQPSSPLWCIVNATRRASMPVVGPGQRDEESGPTESRYRYTAAQLDEIRDAEGRFEGVETITALVKAFGEPDVVVDGKVNNGGGFEYTKRRFVFHRRWKAIDVDVSEYFGGKYGLMIMPKPGATQPGDAR